MGWGDRERSPHRLGTSVDTGCDLGQNRHGTSWNIWNLPELDDYMSTHEHTSHAKDGLIWFDSVQDGKRCILVVIHVKSAKGRQAAQALDFETDSSSWKVRAEQVRSAFGVYKHM